MPHRVGLRPPPRRLTLPAAARAGYGGGMSSAKAALESDTRVLAYEAGRKYQVRGRSALCGCGRVCGCGCGGWVGGGEGLEGAAGEPGHPTGVCIRAALVGAVSDGLACCSSGRWALGGARRSRVGPSLAPCSAQATLARHALVLSQLCQHRPTHSPAPNHAHPHAHAHAHAPPCAGACQRHLRRPPGLPRRQGHRLHRRHDPVGGVGVRGRTITWSALPISGAAGVSSLAA